MATQTGSIDLEATNAVKLAAEASVDNKLTNYATHAQLNLSADNIKAEVAETYATKSEAALELSKSGTVVVLDEAADARLKALTIHGKSVQDGTPTPSAPVTIWSIRSENLLDDSNVYQMAAGGIGIVSSASYRSVWCEIPPASSTRTFSFVRNTVEGNRFRIYGTKVKPEDGVILYNIFSTDDAALAGTFSVDATYKFIFIYLSNAGATISAGNIAIYEGADAPSTVIPYGTLSVETKDSANVTTVYPIDLQGNSLRSLPDGTRDGLKVEGGSKVLVKRVGVVDLGTLTWTMTERPASSGTYRFNSSAFATGLSGTNANILCSMYAANAAYGPTGNNSVDGAMCMYDNNVYIRNDAYTTAAGFKTAMNGVMLLYPLATPQEIDLGAVSLPYVSDGDSVWVDAQVTPNIDVAYWSENGETVSALSSTLTQTAAGLELELQGKVDSDEEWVSWMHAGTDPTTHEPYLAMGQDSDYPSVVYGGSAAKFYDGEGDAASNVVASFGADGAVVGYESAAHFEQTDTESKWFGSDGTTQLAEITTENNYPMLWLKDSERRVIAGQMTYLGISDTEYSDYINVASYGVYNNHDAEVNLIASGTSGTAKFKVADTVPIAPEPTPANMLLTPSVLKLSVGYEQEGGTATLDATAKAAWLAALGLTVQEGAMTFASGLNSSYGSAPVRKYGAMGILKLNSVRLASQLASGGSVVIGTLPTGYVPVGSVDMHINIESNSSNYRNNYIIIEYSGSTNPGRVTLYNRSGYAIPNTVTFSCTCPFFIG